MNPKQLVKLSNIIGIVAIILLVYWVFIFSSVNVFGFKVFQENISESFVMSIMGILALMLGALIINIMMNLTRIAQKHNQDANAENKRSRKTMWILIGLSFPIIFALLFLGDRLSSKEKEKVLIQSAESMMVDHPLMVQDLLEYSFTKNWIGKSAESLQILSKTDKNFPHISVISRDSIGNSQFYLSFDQYSANLIRDTIPAKKKDYLLKTSQIEREYFETVFYKGETPIRFSAHDGNYELFYPISQKGETIVFHFSDRRQYGKIGS